MAASRTIAVRLTLEEADQFRAALKGAGTDGEAALKRITDAAKQTSSAMVENTATGKLQAYQLREIAEDAHKFADQVLSGGSALKAFAFQAPNAIAIAGGFKNALAAVTGLFTPFRTGALLAVGGITALVVAAESADAKMVKLRNGLIGYSADYVALAQRIAVSSRQQAEQLKLPSGDVRSAQTAITVALPTLNDADVQKSVALGQKLALTIDHDLSGAMERLAQMARDPAAAVKSLAEQGFGGLSAQLVRNIDLMQRSGDRAGAYKLAADALARSLSGAQMTDAQKAASNLSTEWDHLWTGISDGLAGPGAKLLSWLAESMKGIRELREGGAFMPPEPVIPDYAKRPLFGTGSGTPPPASFASISGPISATASARGYDPQVALAMAALESRFGQQTGGGANNPFNITAAPGQDATTGTDNQNGRQYNFRNFTSAGEATSAFLDLIDRKYPGLKDAGRDPLKIATALRVGEPGGYAEGIGSNVDDRRAGYANGLSGVFRRLTATASAETLPTIDVTAPSGARDLDAGHGLRYPVPGYSDTDYVKQRSAADASTLYGRRQSADADIKGTQEALDAATRKGDTDGIAELTEKLRTQRAELEKLRSPVQEYIKGLGDQANAAKDSTGASGEVTKAIADLNRVGKDSGWQVTEADRAQVVAATLSRLSAEYRKTGQEISHATAQSLDQAHAWDASNAAGRAAEAQQKAYADAIKVDRDGTPAFLAAMAQRTKAYQDQASAAAAAGAASKLVSDRQEAETLQLQIDLAKRGAGPDDQARALAALKTQQSLEGVTDPQTRAALTASSQGNEELRLKYASITANTNELSSFMSSSFDKIGSDITQAFTNGAKASETFGNISKAVISEVAQELIKLSVINPLKNALEGNNSSLPTLSGVFGKLFGSSSTVGGASASATAAASASASYADFFHSGGIVGSEPTFTRMLPLSTWHGAPRYHTGGLAGDEVPAVLQAGEGVFTPGQMKALGGASSNGAQSGGDIHLHMHINAQGAGPREIETLRNQMPGIALAAVQNASLRGGKFASSVRGR